MVAVAEPGGDFGYIDEHDAYVIAPRFAFAQEFVNGIARVQQRAADGHKQFGYIDRHGVFVYGPFPIP